MVAAAMAIDDSWVGARRFEIRAPRVKADGETSTEVHSKCGVSVLLAGLCEGGELRLGSLVLVLRFPFLEWHAVDRLPALILGHRHAALVGGFLHPVRKAIPPEPRELHQVDVLPIL